MNMSEEAKVPSAHGLIMTLITRGCLIALLLVPGFEQAGAQSIGSSYTSTAPKDCRQIGKPGTLDGSTTRICPGKAGLIVLLAEDDLGELVSVGRNRASAAEQPAAKVGFSPFNSSEPRVEWRALRDKPLAIIQRWHIADNADLDGKGRPNTKAMLAVTRLPPGPVCHVAYVDAVANPNANELAREAADTLARGFACGKDEVKIIGTSGRAVELATCATMPTVYEASHRAGCNRGHSVHDKPQSANPLQQKALPPAQLHRTHVRTPQGLASHRDPL